MKRFITLFLAIIIALSTTLISSATTSTGTTIESNGFTVTFTSDSNFTAEEQQLIVDHIFSSMSSNEADTTYNLLCTLFGHKTTTESITVVEHCASDTQPRCRRSLQDVTTCSRCDYVDISVFSSTYIYCCE